MYLYITETGYKYLVDVLDDDMPQEADDGIAELINLDERTEYYQGRWEAIKEWE